MATAAVCGNSGTITGVAGVTEVTSFEITVEVDAVDATSMASAGWRERVACLTRASGTFRSIGANAGVGPDASATFKTASSGGATIAGNIIITEVQIVTPVEGIVEYNHTFQFTGTVTVS